jgi:hypothetical protein
LRQYVESNRADQDAGGDFRSVHLSLFNQTLSFILPQPAVHYWVSNQLFTNGRKWEKASAAFAHQRGTAGDSEGGKEAAIADDPAGGPDALESGGEKRGSPCSIPRTMAAQRLRHLTR